ncbi:MOSC domain-containing protein [Aliiglaciecola sp. CAU 1673]|uniref:MOSC domain-containing protein n=1 Tax=Aliiglaciecola sp. CAU 1673 TaxID=3032595 RepID=UPI0023DA258F|nr:MOSC domain-containing protein [Aliiglaciecola sp. CAU 1673]MDF2179676.1 MOSC domain-containing protein [Aliiglaciecola sp. CAU 1673]
MSRISLAQISIYPIKSTRGLTLDRSWVEETGLSFDRRYMLADMNGRMLTGRAFPKLVQVLTAPTAWGLMVSHPDMPMLALRCTDFSMQGVATHVWKDEFEAFATTETANQWFSRLLGRDCQLLYASENSPRFSQSASAKVSFADGYSLLLISQASLQALNAKAAVPSQMAQFRPNLVVSNTEPFAEDSWQTFRIGDVTFRVDSPCSRCIFTTRDPATGEFLENKEPLATLSRFRKHESGKINFGMNVTPLNEGMIACDMEIEVLSTRTAERYPVS